MKAIQTGVRMVEIVWLHSGRMRSWNAMLLRDCCLEGISHALSYWTLSQKIMVSLIRWILFLVESKQRLQTTTFFQVKIGIYLLFHFLLFSQDTLNLTT